MIIKIDRLVDIMNNICQMIDYLDHFHIQELLDIMFFFVNGKMKQKIVMNILSHGNVTRICHG